jgi:hypothetical protein
VYEGVIGILGCAIQFFEYSGRLFRATHRPGSCVFVLSNQLVPIRGIFLPRYIRATTTLSDSDPPRRRAGSALRNAMMSLQCGRESSMILSPLIAETGHCGQEGWSANHR